MFDQTFKSLNQLTVGFDNLFDHVEQILEEAPKVLGFPPFNIYQNVVNGNVDKSSYVIELAVAGFSRDNLSVHLSAKTGVQQLTVSGNKDHRDAKDEGGRFYIAHGLAARKFTRSFSLAENIRVDSVSLVDGILTIKLSTVNGQPSVKLLTIE